MIHSKEIKTKLEQYYKNINEVRESSIISCERRSSGNEAYQKFYFDFSERIERLENIRNFVREVVATDYYDTAGSIKWNYYLAFITGQEISPELRRLVESDDDYARKFIIKYNDLDIWLSTTYKVQGKSDLGDYDLANVWRNRLREANLAVIGERPDVKIAEGVNYLLGITSLPEVTSKKTRKGQVSGDVSPGSLSTFDIGNFRPHPLGSPFSFKKVNLIDGINGVGKTSLLESIEYFLSGSTSSSNGSASDKNHSIRGCFGSDKWVSFVHDYELFRKRDADWYQSKSRRGGSDLNKHFNKFNFYNSEAAFQLARGDEEELEDAFRDIALGDEVSYLRSQMKKYRDPLSRSLNAWTTELSKLRSRRLELDNQIDEHTSPQTSPDEAFAEAKKLFDEIFSIRSLPDSVDDDLSGIHVDVSKALSIVNDIAMNVDWLEDFSISSLAKEQQKVQTVSDFLSDCDSKIHKQQEQLEALDASTKLKDLEIERLEVILPYYELGISQEVTGLNERTRKLTFLLNPILEAENIYSKLSNSLTETSLLNQYPNIAFPEIKESVAKTFSQTENLLNSTAIRIEEIESVLTEIENLYAELKSTATHLLETDTDTSDCPVCGEHYKSNPELLKKITDSAFTSSRNQELVELQKRFRDLRIGQDKTQKLLDYFKGVDEINRLLDERLNLTSTLESIHAQLAEEFNNVSQYTSELERLDTINLRLKSANLSEKAFNGIAEDLKKIFKTDLTQETLESVQNRLTKNKEELDAIINRVEKVRNDIAELMNEKAIVIANYDHSIPDANSNPVINNRLSILKNIANRLKENVSLSMRKNANINVLEDRLSSLSATLNIIVQEKESAKNAKSFLARCLQERKRNNLEDISLNKKVETLSGQVTILDNLLASEDEKKYLDEFLRQNEQQILNIFMAVHRPREFKGISLKKGKVRLTRTTDKVAGLYEISSGQRSALALSIFLTLNSKLPAECPYILFDDPITNVDDLNVLSFLDYLREIVVNSGNTRQVFFATASADLAFLFEKKFEFMDKDYNRICLSRTDL